MAEHMAGGIYDPDILWPGYPPDDTRETIDAISSQNRIR